MIKKRVELLNKVVREAGEAIEEIGLSQVVKTKAGELDLVTKGDLESERIIVEAIKKNFPEDKILSEETAVEKGIEDFEGYLWVIDPIDGTLNYSRGRNYCAVSVGLTRKREVLAGAVYSPFTCEFYFSQLGKGAYLNNNPIRCSSVSEVNKSMLTTDNNWEPGRLRVRMEKYLLPFESAMFFMSGSAVLSICEVAAGKTDLYIHNGLKPWDNAAAFAIAREAGVEIVDLKGKKIDFYSPEVLMANPRLLSNFLKEVE